VTEPFLISDHAARAVANLTSEFDNASDLQALLTEVIMPEVQELEVLFYSLITERLLDGATGAQLDAWGKIVGEPRDGLNDTQYREFIRARIRTNLAEGEIERIIDVLKTITMADTVRFIPAFPASFVVQFEVTSYGDPGFNNRVKNQIESITPSGVGIQIVEAKTDAFGFAEDPTALGFGVGEFASVI